MYKPVISMALTNRTIEKMWNNKSLLWRKPTEDAALNNQFIVFDAIMSVGIQSLQTQAKISQDSASNISN